MTQLSTLDLANLILQCVAGGDSSNLGTENLNELEIILLNKDAEKLAYWLQFHSFIKYKFDKITNNFTEINIEDPEPDLIAAVNEIISAFSREQEAKKSLVKFKNEDFSNSDYVALSQEISNLHSQIRSSENALREDSIQPLLNAKTRRNKELSRHANIKAIGAPDYATEFAHRKLVKAIVGLKPNERKQLLYYHFGEAHAFGFDIERTPEGKLLIFSFETVTDAKHLHALQLLHNSLSQLGENFEIRSCNSFLQKDGYNCATYTLAVLSELSKYDHVFSYLPETYEEDTEVIALRGRELTMPHGGMLSNTNRKFKFEVVDKIKWIKLSDMPTKIISMGQSHTEMEELLKQAPGFDLDPAKFIEILKEKYQFDPRNPQTTKYINRRRERIASHVEKSKDSVKQDAYAKFLEKMPLLGLIDKVVTPDFNKEITENDHLKLDEKISYIKNLFLAMTIRRGFGWALRSSDLVDFSEHEVNILILLRNEYLRLLAKKDFEEAKKVIGSYGDPIFHNELDSILKERPVPSEVQPLSAVFNEVFSQGQRIAIYRDIKKFYLPKALDIHNPFISLYEINPSELTAGKIDELFSKLEDDYRDPETGISIFDAERKLELLTGFIEKFGKKNIADLSNEQIHAMFFLRNKCISLLSELKVGEGRLINYLYSMSSFFRKFDTQNSEFSSIQLDASIKSFHTEMAENFTKEELLFIDTELHESVFGRFVVDPTNPLLELIGTENFTKENIVMTLRKVREDYRDINGKSRIKLYGLVGFINETIRAVDSLPFDERTHAFGELKKAYLALLSERKRGFNQICTSDLIVKRILFPFLGNKKALPMNERNILKLVSDSDNLLVKLSLLETAFYCITSPYLNGIYESASEGYTAQQIADINVLKSVYVKLIKNEPYDREDSDFNSKLQKFVEIRNRGGIPTFTSLIDISHNDSSGAMVSIRSDIDRMVNGELRPIKQAVTISELSWISFFSILPLSIISWLPYFRSDGDKLAGDEVDSVEQSDTVGESGWISFFGNLPSLILCWIPYFSKQAVKPVHDGPTQINQGVLEAQGQIDAFVEPNQVDDVAGKQSEEEDSRTLQFASNTLGFFSESSHKKTTSKQSLSNIINSFYTSSEQHFQSDSLNIELIRSSTSKSGFGKDITSWIQYNRLHPDVGNFEDNWKLNLAIFEEDIPKAFEIIAELAQKNNLACFKVMSQAQARASMKTFPHMLGREMVIYCGANPEFNGEKWIEIIQEIETALDEAGVRTSKEIPPSSNRGIGKYTSYTHHAWTTGVDMRIPFDKGIKETGLEDEDLFKDYPPMLKMGCTLNA
ncbi:hypothetical protein [Legionella micdadei]|uniref:hypothetical protein n=1 Tax=Legionella micdadei TaxID=451 RepID=UPI0009EF76DB|nr:hypothetical protein [Legionella micdadei]ARH00087.1 hypothetical protein B6V88_06470 [Legionella micdadei]